MMGHGWTHCCNLFFVLTWLLCITLYLTYIDNCEYTLHVVAIPNVWFWYSKPHAVVIFEIHTYNMFTPSVFWHDSDIFMFTRKLPITRVDLKMSSWLTTGGWKPLIIWKWQHVMLLPCLCKMYLVQLLWLQAVAYMLVLPELDKRDR